MTAESFDAVLAEAYEWARPGNPADRTALRAILDRLQAAHEREVGDIREEWNVALRAFEKKSAYVNEAQARADRAVGLLRFLRDRFEKHMDESDKTAINAFLSEQAGERENGK